MAAPSNINRDTILRELPQWLEHNFPDTTPIQQYMGIIEELGELGEKLLLLEQMTNHEYYMIVAFSYFARAVHQRLKRIQKVRQINPGYGEETEAINQAIQALTAYRERIRDASVEVWKPQINTRTRTKYINERNNAIGDLDIFLQGFCEKSDVDREAILRDTWAEVRERDWKKFPKNGKDR